MDLLDTEPLAEAWEMTTSFLRAAWKTIKSSSSLWSVEVISVFVSLIAFLVSTLYTEPKCRHKGGAALLLALTPLLSTTFVMLFTIIRNLCNDRAAAKRAKDAEEVAAKRDQEAVKRAKDAEEVAAKRYQELKRTNEELKRDIEELKRENAVIAKNAEDASDLRVKRVINEVKKSNTGSYAPVEWDV